MLKELLQKKAKAVADIKAIQESAKAQGRDVNADETAKIDALLAEIEGLNEQIAKAEQDEARAAKIAAAQASLNAPRPRASQTVTVDTNATKTIDMSDTAVTSGLHDRAKDDPKCGFRSYDDFASMVLHSTRFGGVSGPWANRAEITAAAYGQNTYNGEDGGFTVPPEFSNEMYNRAMTGNALRAALFGPMQKRRTAANSLTITAMVDHDKSSTTYRNGGIVVYLVDEAAQVTRSSLKVRKVELKLHKMGAISFATSEELADGSIDGTMLLNKHADAMGDEWLEYALWGTGAGQPLGMLHANNASVIESPIEVAQTTDTVVLENILKMLDRLWVNSEATALFVANLETRMWLRTLKLDIGTGGSVVPLFERGRAGETPDILDGRPLYFSDHAPALGDTGDIALVDPTQYVWLTKRGQELQTNSSIHLRFDYDETAFMTTWRADGRPLWENQLRPRKGASAKRESPFVKLLTR